MFKCVIVTYKCFYCGVYAGPLNRWNNWTFCPGPRLNCGGKSWISTDRFTIGESIYNGPGSAFNELSSVDPLLQAPISAAEGIFYIMYNVLFSGPAYTPQ